MEAQARSKGNPTNPADKHITLEEYFELEYKAEAKHEYWDGSIRAMSYTSPNHGRLQTNLMDALATCMKSKNCLRYTSDRMVLVPECNKVFYPDILIICDKEQFSLYKKNMKATLNPTVIIEILSDTTEQEDKIDKWMCYRSISSLQQYIMVHQDRISVHSFRRKGSKEWDYTYADETEEEMLVQDCPVRLQDLYEGVDIR
jgi:Uma2 family endonuclease